MHGAAAPDRKREVGGHPTQGEGQNGYREGNRCARKCETENGGREKRIGKLVIKLKVKVRVGIISLLSEMCVLVMFGVFMGSARQLSLSS